MLKVCLVGIGGRMGHMLWECSKKIDGLEVVSGIDINADAVPAGCTVEVVPTAAELTAVPDVFLDFTRPVCSLQVLEYAKAHGCRYVLGTTGFDEAGKAAISEAAQVIPVVFAANFSVGVNVLCALMKKAAAIMADADIEIVEAHHRFKVDAPSGTAIAMGEAAAAGRGVKLKDVKVAGRDGITGERKAGTIGFASIRGGDIVGDHTAMFCCDGERLELGHKASSRATFANGALRSALWLADKGPGLYSMQQVLGL